MPGQRSTSAALMVGLSILIVMQTQGNSMIKGWRLPNKFPDIFIMAGVTSGLNWVSVVTSSWP